jgi:ABC-type transport system involved in multi-copper enzyme maturation permease subunit
MRRVDLKKSPLLTIARYTLKGYIKERVLLVVLIFAFVLMVSSYVLAPLAVGSQQKIIVDIGLAYISIIGILLVVLLGASSYSREKLRGILPSILAKPLSRVDFLIGKYLGTLLAIAMVMISMALVYSLVMLISHTDFNRAIFLAMYFSIIEVALITAVMTFFSSFTSPLLSSFFTICVFISGHLSKDLLSFAEHFGNATFHIVAKGAFFLLPNLSLFNIRPEAVHQLPLPEGYIYMVTMYGLFYSVFVLFVSSMIFRSKDIS